MSELPQGWAWSTIGELAPYIQRGKSPRYADRSELPVVNQRCIRWTRLDTQYLKFIHPEQVDAWDALRRIQPGDVLWNSTGTGTVGRAYLVQAHDCVPAKVVDSHVTIVRPNAAIEPRFLFTWIRSAAVQDKILDMCDGTTNQIELSRTAIAETAVPLAPATEQVRIADQLDILMTRIQACEDRLESIPAVLKRFRQAVLNAAASGELINKSSTSLPLVELRNALAEPLRNGKSVRDGGGLPVLRLTSLKRLGIALTETKNGDWTGIRDARRFLIHDGDYLVSRGNGSKQLVGRGGLVSGCTFDIAFPDTMIRIRPDLNRLLPDYLKYVWEAPVVRRQIEQSAKTTAGIWKVSQPDLERVVLPLPRIEDQAEIVRRVDGLLRIANRIEGRLAAVTKQAQRLGNLTLSKAFRGELLPQDPSDEPASALLARIASERSTSAPYSRPPSPRIGRPPRAPKESSAMTKSRQDDDVIGQPYLAGHLRRFGTPATAEVLFKASELPVADFYKQLAWEVAQGHVKDNLTTLEPGHAAG